MIGQICGGYSPFIRLYCLHVSRSPQPAPRRHPLQGMRREHPRAGRDNAGPAHRGHVSALWRTEAIPTLAGFPGPFVMAIVAKASQECALMQPPSTEHKKDGRVLVIAAVIIAGLRLARDSRAGHKSERVI
jgi:hypothetical protein